MNLDYKRGLKTGIIVYSIGIPVVILTHLVLGFDGGHGPPTSFVVAVALVILGLIRFVSNGSRILTGRAVEKNKGEILIHLIFLGLVAVAFVLMILSIE